MESQKNIFEDLKERIWITFCKTFDIENNLSNKSKFNLEYPRESGCGDFTTNICMVFSKTLSLSPKDIFQKLSQTMQSLDCVKSVDFANPGYLNIAIKTKYLLNYIENITNSLDLFGSTNTRNNNKTKVEFASPNPTGPVHIGHVRGAVYGDVIANLLAKNGYLVTKEYYINDAGAQIEKLTKSLFIRYQQECGIDIQIPSDCYPGDYLINVAKDLINTHGTNLSYQKDFDLIKNFVVSKMIDSIKKDLLKIGIKHDVYTSEFDIIKKGYIQRGLNVLSDKGYIYKGVLPKPKGKASEDWEEKEQILFKSTIFGDDEDRVVKKSDGSDTYFSGDIGYHLNKIERGFQKMILSLGADHLGYVKRITSIVKALQNNTEIDVKLCQLVKFLKNGQPIKMSKRKGTFETLEDVLDEVDASIIRFIMISKKNDIGIDFDHANVKQTRKHN